MSSSSITAVMASTISCGSVTGSSPPNGSGSVGRQQVARERRRELIEQTAAGHRILVGRRLAQQAEQPGAQRLPLGEDAQLFEPVDRHRDVGGVVVGRARHRRTSSGHRPGRRSSRSCRADPDGCGLRRWHETSTPGTTAVPVRAPASSGRRRTSAAPTASWSPGRTSPRPWLAASRRSSAADVRAAACGGSVCARADRVRAPPAAADRAR